MNPLALALAAMIAIGAPPAPPAPELVGAPLAAELAKVRAAQDDFEHRLDVLEKAVDDVAWELKLGHVAEVDKWRIAGPPPAKPRDPDDPALRNPVKFYLYTFVPKDRRAGEKLPVLILPH